MEESRKIGIVSCVGQRSLAVITPINTLLNNIIRDEGIETGAIEIILLYTTDIRSIKTIADKCEEWLKERFQGITVSLISFSTDDKNSIARLCANKTRAYFNTNPGYNWEVAFICLHLPARTVCFSSDTENLYTWYLADDVGKCKAQPLEHLGIASYNGLSRDILIEESDGLKTSLRPDILKVLSDKGLSTSFTVLFNNIINTYPDIIDIINERLVCAREYHGSLYLLFDLAARSGERTKDRTNIFRILTAVFNPVNYFVTIITNDAWWTYERAIAEGVYCIDMSRRNNGWKDELAQWVSGAKHEKLKSLLPRSLEKQVAVNVKEQEDTGAVINENPTLIVCLGDNIETTIKAINSHAAGKVYLFYDATSKRIAYLANRIKNTLMSIDICTIPTDHRGKGMIENIDNILRTNRSPVFNITPGVKTESVAMSVAARRKGVTDAIFSIHDREEKIVQLTDSSRAFPVRNSVADIIKCNIVPFDKDQEERKKGIMEEEFWRLLLDGIAKGNIRPFGFFEGIKFRNADGSWARAKIEQGSSPGNKEVEFVLEDQTIQSTLPEEFLDSEESGGLWWEAVVTKAIHDFIDKDIYWGAIWGWANTKKTFVKSGVVDEPAYSELDIVFSYKNQAAVISCKAGQGKNETLQVSAYLAKSEATKRFGRFALPFVAIPYEERDGKLVGGEVIGEAMVLTPSILADKATLISHIEKFLDIVKPARKRE